MPITISRKFEFDAAHRVMGHEGKCRNLHGHRYIAVVTVTAPDLDKLGRVIDFSVLKSRVGAWIDSVWDHNILLNINDPQLIHLKGTEERDPFVFYSNPTAENIAVRLFDEAARLLGDTGIEVVKVRIYETPNCWAEYAPELRTTNTVVMPHQGGSAEHAALQPTELEEG